MQIRQARKEDADKIAYVHVKSWQSTYQGILPQNVLDNQSDEQRTKQWTENMDYGNVYVAENTDGGIVGFSTGGAERTGKYPDFAGEIYAIYLLETYQRRGIGRRLLVPVIDDLKASGMHSMLVWVLKHNPAIQFYKALGAEYLDQTDLQIAGNTYHEFAYGWKALPQL